MDQNRRKFLKKAAGLGLGAAMFSNMPISAFAKQGQAAFFEISLAQWSLHKALFGKKLDNLDFPAKAKNDFGISVVEYVNQFFKDKAEDNKYLGELLKRCKDHGVKNHLIMCDGEGELGAASEAERKKAVENHYKWVNAAKFLGCASIRVNAAGKGSREEVMAAAVDGLGRLGEYAAKENINVIVENHGGWSSDGGWLSSVMKQVNKPNVGTLPDFGNFCITREPGNWIKCLEEYDRYKGTKELMPYAKGVSAKSYDFDENGNCIETDYSRMMQILKESGWKGYIGIEYEGSKLSEEEGIRATKKLLERFL
jgi:sugar phosphate isomerase/epimerase